MPRWEARSTYGNASPYRVLGRTYEVLDRADGYSEVGNASWYGTKFHGRNTSNGERYDMYAMTAAHRSLPLPTWVRVTRIDGGRSVIVRVNDRGPFHDERILDLSYAAARALGSDTQGVVRVQIEALPFAPPEGAQPAPQPPAASPPVEVATALYLQAGAFSELAGARSMSRALTEVVGERVEIRASPTTPHVYRVRVGPLDDEREASRLQALLITADFGVPLIVEEPLASGTDERG